MRIARVTIGEMSVINDEARSATARAHGGARRADHEETLSVLDRADPFFALHVMRLLSDRLRRTNALT